MLYFKHSELAKTYHVSLKTVHNWIDAAKRDKIKLQLHELGSRTYIANTPANIASLRQLAQQGKKFRNMRHHKIVQPKPEFYEFYSPRQILDIITNLEVHKEIPRQYNYLHQGAHNWDASVNKLEAENVTNIRRGTIELLANNMGSIDSLLAGRKVNIIDIGVGNAYPTKAFLGHLLERNILHRYIALDISPAMLEIARRNIREWYGDAVRFEGYVRDITFERFDELVVDDALKSGDGEVINLVLFLGATATNFRVFSDAFKVIYGSMSRDDLLIYTDKLDTETSRRRFAYSTTLESNSTLAPLDRYILEMLGIDESLYEVERGFDDVEFKKYVRIRFKTSVTLKFAFDGRGHEVSFEKGDTVLLLRVWFLTSLEIITEFEKAGFALLQSSLTLDREYFLSVSGIEAKSDGE